MVDDGKLVGVVTDRDMYIALATRNKRASQVTVGEVVQTPVYTCGPDNDVHAVLATMKQYRVRRLPVEGFGVQTLLGGFGLTELATRCAFVVGTAYEPLPMASFALAVPPRRLRARFMREVSPDGA